MQTAIRSQEALEDEVRKKVDFQYEALKQIIDEKKEEAQEFIKNLESVREYKPLPKNMTSDTLKMLKEFQNNINQKIHEQRSLSEKNQFLSVLQKREGLVEVMDRAKQIDEAIKTNNIQVSQNARPQIKVSAQADKFRGFLQDVVSFEPDYILQSEKPRLHYYDEENSAVFIHELTTQ